MAVMMIHELLRAQRIICILDERPASNLLVYYTYIIYLMKEKMHSQGSRSALFSVTHHSDSIVE